MEGAKMVKFFFTPRNWKNNLFAEYFKIQGGTASLPTPMICDMKLQALQEEFSAHHMTYDLQQKQH